MTLYSFKPKFQKLLKPIVFKLYQRGVTANQVTIVTMLISVILGGVLIFFPAPILYISLPIFLSFRMGLNAIDGMLAREFGQQTKVGDILNEVGDIMSDAALYLPFAFLAGASPWLVVLMVLLCWLTEFCGIIMKTLTGERNYRGPLGKSDRALLFGILGLSIALWPQYLFAINGIFIVASLLLGWTCINRCRNAMVV